MDLWDREAIDHCPPVPAGGSGTQAADQEGRAQKEEPDVTVPPVDYGGVAGELLERVPHE